MAHLDPKAKWLVRKVKGQRDSIFLWTPVLAQKKEFWPISVEEAQKIVDAYDKSHKDIRYRKYRDMVIDKPEETNPVIEEVASQERTPEEIERAKETLKLAKSNDDLLAEELQKIGQMQEPKILEEYFLLKYRIELMGDKPIAEMQKEAAVVLTQLANTGKLYEVKR